MPDRRKNRGPHPKDAQIFAALEIAGLRRAAGDLCWLLSHGYTAKASLKLVGDRYCLRERQRAALQRTAAADETCAARRRSQVSLVAVDGRALWIDGYNVLLTVETALGGGVVLQARDSAFRDMAAMRRHYRRVDQTRGALEAIGAFLAAADVAPVRWYLDQPISNSGRLKALMLETAMAKGWPWEVLLVANPDTILRTAEEIVATADGGILDAGPRWLNLARAVIESAIPEAWIVDFFVDESTSKLDE